MAEVCSHQDESRKGVSATAHAVAIMRAMESIRHGENAWFKDPYAMELGGEVGKNWIARRREEKSISTAEGNTKLDWMAIRTRKIDEEVLKAINSDGYRQVCLIGAGLCTRAWRLDKTVDHSVSYFEVDFPEIFEWKLKVLEEANASTGFDYHKVIADLSLPGWSDTLIAAGFNPSVPTLWLLEGFIGYLKEEEANALFETLTKVLSARGSRVVATLGSNRHRGNDLHCFFPPDPLTWLSSHSWQGRQWEIHELGVEYGRPLPEEAFSGYYIMVAQL